MQTQYLQMVKKICCSVRAPKTNPIQTQLKPKQTQFKPIQTQLLQILTLNAFAWIKSLTIILEMLLADFTTLKGANFRPVTCPALCGNNAASHELIGPILTLYKTANDRYYTRSNCRCSSMEEHSFRKAEVEGSTPSIGFVSL